MAETIENLKNEYPIPVYRFRVSVGGESMAFSEVSGLDIGVETITYKDGLGKKHMPGQATDVNITLKRGLFRGGSQLFEWINSINLNLIDKRDITVSLIDPESDGGSLVTWTVTNAFPKKLTAPSFNGGSNEASVEQLELLADKVSIEFA
ncbi:phage tail protein [Alteromonas sp. a30]|uniref:phage tail protein n=1 Tax=Alteromonas sp. a30 TaxID=2730917 RepID=UPI0022805C58|nr:phage tail protein [Alteromonas sp. a30]MCY7296516.1 phage tail protein [Alteromonas sp. a30]